jgi:hypothetical protein
MTCSRNSSSRTEATRSPLQATRSREEIDNFLALSRAPNLRRTPLPPAPSGCRRGGCGGSRGSRRCGTSAHGRARRQLPSTCSVCPSDRAGTPGVPRDEQAPESGAQDPLERGPGERGARARTGSCLCRRRSPCARRRCRGTPISRPPSGRILSGRVSAVATAIAAAASDASGKAGSRGGLVCRRSLGGRRPVRRRRVGSDALEDALAARTSQNLLDLGDPPCACAQVLERESSLPRVWYSSPR